MWLSPKISAAVAVALIGLVVAVRRFRRGHAGWQLAATFAQETAIVCGLYTIWQIAGTLSVMHTTRARSRGLSIWHLERHLHLPSEVSVQNWFLAQRWLAEAADGYYAIVHVPALIVFLIWLFTWHRDRYRPWRNALAMLTGACLLIQLVPVAPPRMYPGLGFVDVAVRFHQSVYGPVGSGMADQLSAMPSVHVAWAVLIGAAAIRVSRSRWRWAVLAHPVLTVLVVTATANHWWLDGAVAVAILAVAVVLADAIERVIAALRTRQPAFAVRSAPS